MKMTLDQEPSRRLAKKSRGLDPVDFGTMVRGKDLSKIPRHQPKFYPSPSVLNSHSTPPELEEEWGGCPLESFYNPRRLGVIPGLDFKDGNLILNPCKWGCCQATGERFHPTDHMTYRCDLNFRFQETQALFERIKTQYPDGNMMEVFAPTRFSVILDQLAKIASKELLQGRVFTRDSQKHPFPALFWATGLAAIWRFGLKIKVKHFAYPQEFILGQKRTELHGTNADKDDYDVMMISHVGDLWSAKSYENLDYLVTSAYNSCKPLFLDLGVDSEALGKNTASSSGRPSGESSLGGMRSTKTGFKSLITQARQKTTARIYSPGFLRKMRAVTLGIPRVIFESAPHQS
jgi:hypothetical protein